MSIVSRQSFALEGSSVSDPQKKRGYLDRYLKWLDDEPLKARCVSYAVIGACGALLGARKNSIARPNPTIDWPEVISFIIHGGLVAGPLSHYLNEFLEENFYDSRSQAVLFEQIIAQPPQLFLMFAFLEVSKSAILSIPDAIRRSSSLLGSAVVDGWRLWPLSTFLLLKAVKKRKHYVAALKLISVAFASHLAKRRSRTSP